MTAPIAPALKRFIWDIQSMVELTEDAREILLIGSDLMARLLAGDSWLPDAFAAASPEGPRQFQLYADEAERFCVVATVLDKGQTLPLLRAPFWQLLGVLRGPLTLEKLALSDQGTAQAAGMRRALGPGAVERLTPKPDEAFQLANAGGEVTVALHVHGGEIKTCPRYRVTADGRLEEVDFAYANPADAPPYDIWSIQTKIED